MPSPILVAIGDTPASDTGPLACPKSSQDAAGPRVGRIISIEGDSEEEGDEKAALMQAERRRRRRTESDSSLHEKEQPTLGRTTRPAPPRPTVRRADSLKQPPSVTDGDVHRLEAQAGSSSYTPMIKLQEPSPKVIRYSVLNFHTISQDTVSILSVPNCSLIPRSQFLAVVICVIPLSYCKGQNVWSREA